MQLITQLNPEIVFAMHAQRSQALTTVVSDSTVNTTIPPDAGVIAAVLAQLGTQLIGKEHQIQLALACLIGRGHMLIEDVPGVGKTTLAQVLAVTLGLPTRRIQFTSDLLPGDITGVSVYDARTQQFEFKSGPIFTSIVLADEINRAPPRAQSALLEAMEERQVTVDGQTHPLNDHFFVIATQNPSDQLGVYPLPESQLDRFLAGLELGYPDSASERELLRGGDRRRTVDALSALIDSDTLTQWSDYASNLPVSDLLLDYVQALLAQTRLAGSNGLSPRAGLQLLTMARAWATVQGESCVVPEDVQAVFTAVAGHRLTGSVRDGITHCRSVIESVPVP